MFLWCLIPDLVAFFARLILLAVAYHRQTYMYPPLLRDLEDAEEEFRDFQS